MTPRMSMCRCQAGMRCPCGVDAATDAANVCGWATNCYTRPHLGGCGTQRRICPHVSAPGGYALPRLEWLCVALILHMAACVHVSAPSG
jgi:hypothetical protein